MFWRKRTYLDHAAGAAGNPSSPHEEGRRAKGQLEAARVVIARLLEVQVDDVIFTSGATESNALAILGYVRAIRRHRRNNAHVLYLPSAHASVVENMHLLAEEGVIIEKLPIVDGRVDTDALAHMITVNTVMVSMDAVCGETGVVWNTREVAEVLKKREEVRHPQQLRMSDFLKMRAVLHVDASQAPLTEKITRAHFSADVLTLDGSKVGIRGIGALIAHRTIPIEPLYRGGGQERGLRPGTEVPELAEKFAAALRAAAERREAFVATATKLRAQLIEAITKAVPDVCINEGRAQAPNILNISLPGRDPSRQGGAEVDTDYLVVLLDEAGFAVSTRSACETDSEEGSRAVLALTGDIERAKATLRVSWGVGITSSDLTRFVLALVKGLKLC